MLLPPIEDWKWWNSNRGRWETTAGEPWPDEDEDEDDEMIADIELSIHVPTEDGTAECGRITGDNPFGMTIIKMALEAEGLEVRTVRNTLLEPTVLELVRS